MYFNYDSFNRAIETGYCVENKTFKLLSDEIGKSLNYLPSTKSKVLTKTFYDNYNFAGVTSFISATDKSCNLKYTDKVKGLVTGTKVRVLGISDERWITTTNYYDSKYRLVQSVKNLYHDGKSVVSNRYDFLGNVLQTKESQTFNNSTKIVDTYFAYDHRSRLLNVSQSLDGLKQRILVSMEYNELGQLINKKLNGSIDVKYAYNIRGWLKKINSQKFGMSLYYNDSEGALGGLETKNLFNGNITAIKWENSEVDKNISGNENNQAYAFSYDGISRLNAADYANGSGLADVDRYDVSGISYDVNGNILSLRRNSYDIKARKTVNLDDLVYGYSGNQLKRVEDTGSSSGFKNGASVDVEYLYDANGNMTRDLNKGIKNIKYNELNLPESISFADGRKISYIYSATGEKLQNIVGGKTISYCGGFVYEDGKLAYILNSEGRYVVNGSDGVYEYNICDHLGNVRAVVDGAGTVKQQSNYYPFGGVFAQAGKSDNKYLYNGKEKQEGTDWLDYGARMYSADLGRFMTVDPKATSYYSQSPFAYAANNPIKYIDYNGEHPIIVIAGVVLGTTELCLISAGVISTGIILSKPRNGSIGFSIGFRNLFAKNKVRSKTKTKSFQNKSRKKQTKRQIKSNNNKNSYGPKEVVKALIAFGFLDLYIKFKEAVDVDHDEYTSSNYSSDKNKEKSQTPKKKKIPKKEKPPKKKKASNEK